MEDYKEKYEMALERARKLYKDAITLQLEQDIKDYETIFPELKESEDELTWLTKFIEEEAYSLSMDIRDNYDRLKLKNLQKSLAWLEKQGERKQEWSEEDERMRQETIDWFEKKCFPYAIEYENPARESIQWLKSLKGRVQPKPKEWNDEDDYSLQCMIAKVTYDIQKGNVGRNNELIDWLKSLKERVQPQPKQEWSDEDENYLQSAENACEYQYGKNTSTILWLKSLKERVQPQPKQEWSDEDEFRLNRTVENIELLNDANGDILFKDIEWLKSLKDRLSNVKKH